MCDPLIQVYGGKTITTDKLNSCTYSCFQSFL